LDKSQTQIKTIAVLADIRIYQKTSPAVILMVDDVGVKAQKPHKKVDRIPADAKGLNTTLVLIEDSKSPIIMQPRG